MSQDYLLPQMNKLAEDHFVIFYDQRGSGKSEGGQTPENISLSVFTDDLDAVRKKFGFEKVSLLGHSWGGFLAMQYAIAHPEAVDKLILMNSMPASSSDLALFLQEWDHRMAPHAKKLQKLESSLEFAAGDPDTVASYYTIAFRTFCAVEKKADELNLMASSLANKNGLKTADILRRTVLLQPFDIRDSLKKLPCKTLIVHGDKDPVPASAAENLHKSIPNSQLAVIKECGHFPYVEKPQELFGILKEFLQDVPSLNKKVGVE